MAKKNPCMSCDGKCCRHIALEIDTPDDRHSFQNIRWHLSHRGVTVFVEEGKWYLQVRTKCRYLDGNNLCTNYANRPDICHEYKSDACEASGLEYDYELHFKSDAEFDAWLQVTGNSKIK